MQTRTGPDRAAAALAERQDGVLTLEQALACGLSAEQVRRRIESGRWEQLVRGVYRLAGAPDTWRQRTRAAQLAVAPAGGVASHASAAALHGLRPPPALPQVTVPAGRSPRCPIAKVRRGTLDTADLATVEGIRCSSASRVLVEMAGLLARPDLEDLVDDAICSGRASVAAALRAVERCTARGGRVLLRSVLEVWSEAIEPGSPAEVRLLRRIDEWGLPAPVTQHEIRLPDGSFVARVDVAWPGALVAVEYEGVRPHAVRRNDPDERRYARIRALGWRLTTADKHDVLPGNRRLGDLLGRWLAAAGAA